MRTTATFLMILFLAACSKPAVEKPDNLIEEGKMVDIMYDLSLLEAQTYRSKGSPSDSADLLAVQTRTSNTYMHQYVA